MANVSFKLVQFAVSKPLGDRMQDGHSNMSRAAEQDLPQMVETFSRSVSQNKMDDLDSLQKSPAFPAMRQLLDEVSQVCDPHDSEKFPFGFSVLPSAVHHSKDENIFAVDLNPVDMRFATPSAVLDKPVARVFIDTTPGYDGVEYLLSC